MSRELGHCDVHAEADAEVGNAALRATRRQARILPSQPRGAEAAGHEHAVDLFELTLGLLQDIPLGVRPADVDVAAVVDARVLQRFVHGQVRVVQLHVLADEGDLHRLLPLPDARRERLPLAQSNRARLEAELLAYERVEP